MKLLVFLTVAMATQASWIPDFSHNWTNLRVSWNLIPFKGFDEMPLTVQDKGKFELRDDFCANPNGKFFGQRYWKNKDAALSLLFDKNGVVAGIQTSVPKAKFNASPKNLNYVDDGDFWTLTAYFMEPSQICSTGRNAADLKQGTAAGLWIQTTSDPMNGGLYKVPEKEEDIKGKDKWGYGKCFWTMGQHYWYNIKKDMDCDADLTPNCLLYNGGKLTGFCFAINGNFDSDRYDYPKPKKDVIKKFMDPVPDCFANNPAYAIQSTVHVYFSDQPKYSSWC
jgi:charged multivesicular body protein 7